mgnify:FL=1
MDYLLLLFCALGMAMIAYLSYLASKPKVVSPNANHVVIDISDNINQEGVKVRHFYLGGKLVSYIILEDINRVVYLSK